MQPQLQIHLLFAKVENEIHSSATLLGLLAFSFHSVARRGKDELLKLIQRIKMQKRGNLYRFEHGILVDVSSYTLGTVGIFQNSHLSGLERLVEKRKVSSRPNCFCHGYLEE